MAVSGDCLGICFADHQLYYAVNDPARRNHLKYIGCIDFNFPVIEALINPESQNYDALKRSIGRLQHSYSNRNVRMLSPAVYECWTIFPRLVYETPDERDDHLSVLMDGMPRSETEPTWFELSNPDYKLLLVRNRSITDNYRNLLLGFNQIDLVSEFEIGMEWRCLTSLKGSYLTVNCRHDHIAISSYLLGKLRGATFIRFDTVSDLIYFWNFYGQHLHWLHGIHEQVYIYGNNAMEIIETMGSYLNETGELITMNSLEQMQVVADESTYGFRLESAFPAVLLSLNLSGQMNENHRV